MCDLETAFPWGQMDEKSRRGRGRAGRPGGRAATDSESTKVTEVARNVIRNHYHKLAQHHVRRGEERGGEEV